MSETKIEAKPEKPETLDVQAAKDKEDEAKLKEFFDKFTALSKEYGYDVSAKLEITGTSITAVPLIVKLKKDESVR